MATKSPKISPENVNKIYALFDENKELLSYAKKGTPKMMMEMIKEKIGITISYNQYIRLLTLYRTANHVTLKYVSPIIIKQSNVSRYGEREIIDKTKETKEVKE